MICENEYVGVADVNTFKSYRDSLVIPAIPPTDEITSNVCKVQYVLRVIGAVSYCHNDVVLEFPIKIGTYPILDELHITSYPTTRRQSSRLYEFPVSQRPDLAVDAVSKLPAVTAAYERRPLLRQHEIHADEDEDEVVGADFDDTVDGAAIPLRPIRAPRLPIAALIAPLASTQSLSDPVDPHTPVPVAAGDDSRHAILARALSMPSAPFPECGKRQHRPKFAHVLFLN